MARIIYKPHCSKCGAVINDKVMYKTIELVKKERVMKVWNIEKVVL